MPWIACFLAGAFWGGNRAEIRQLRDDNRALIAEQAEARVKIETLGAGLAEAERAGAAAETKRREDYERFQTAKRRARVVVTECRPDPRELVGLRQQIDAANRYALGRVSGGTEHGEGEDAADAGAAAADRR